MKMSNSGDLLSGLDDMDALIILSIGEHGAKSTKIQKIALLLSKFLNIELDTEAYNFGGFSETIQERLVTPINRDYYYKKGEKYVLSKKGIQAYHILLEKLKERRPDISEILEALQSIPDKDLIAITYFLFPETAEKSQIKDEIEKRIEEMKELGKKKFKISRNDNKIYIETIE